MSYEKHPLQRNLKSAIRVNSYKLKKPLVNILIRQNFFSVRVVNAWNSLPQEVVLAPILNSFQTDKLWADHKFCLDSDWFKVPKPSSANQIFATKESEE